MILIRSGAIFVDIFLRLYLSHYILIMKYIILILLLPSVLGCAPFEWKKGYWNVEDAMEDCMKELAKVSYNGECDDTTSDTSINGYGEVWLVNKETDRIKTIWRIR